MERLTFGCDLGPVKVLGLKADHHCEVFVDGQRMGHLYKGQGLFEYRGSPIGGEEISFLCRIDKRDLVRNLVDSLRATELAKKPCDLEQPSVP